MYHLEVVNHDETFARLSIQPIIANYLDITTYEGRQKLNKLLYTRYEGDTMSVLPSCDCGHVKEAHNVGVRCNLCGTLCEHPLEKPMESALWIKAPEHVTALINPVAWNILSNAMTTSGFNMLEWLTNTAYKPKGKIPDKLERFEMLGFQRGLNNFVQNFDAIMEAAMSIKPLVKDNVHGDLRNWIRENRHRIFSTYVPMPSKVGFVIESTGTMSYTDKTIIMAINALRNIVSIENATSPMTPIRRQNRTVKAIAALAAYHKEFYRKVLGGKPGVFRKQIFGIRTHFSARAVISSNSDIHRYDELHIPWSLALQLFRLHLVNKLLKRGYSPAQLELMFRDAAMKYSPLFDELFQELIRESPYDGIPCTFGRNPTLARLSIQLFYITRVKTDPNINTISISVLALKGPNADFDGDEMNLTLINDRYMHDKLSRLAPHLGALDLNAPRRISKNLTLPSPVIATLANWISEEVD